MGGEVPGARPDHSPPPSAKVKNDWSCISTPQYALMVRTETTTLCIPVPLFSYFCNIRVYQSASVEDFTILGYEAVQSGI
jgi:hypothetical protein